MQKVDNTIINKCIEGDQNAMMQLYDGYCNAMYAIAHRYLKREEDAKDAMQDGFLKAFKNIQNYNTDGHFGAWLKRIIINQCIDVLKKKKLDTVTIDELPFDFTESINEEDWSVDDSISKEMIINAIENLPKKYMLVVKLYLMEGYDHTEISQILEIPVKTSRTRLRRGKLNLKDYLNKRHYEKRH